MLLIVGLVLFFASGDGLGLRRRSSGAYVGLSQGSLSAAAITFQVSERAEHAARSSRCRVGPLEF